MFDWFQRESVPTASRADARWVVLDLETSGLDPKLDRIVEIAHRHGLLVIEDCAQSLFADYKGRMTGAWGDVGCFSFQAHKQLSTGDGGMATTNDPAFVSTSPHRREHPRSTLSPTTWTSTIA